MKQISLVKSLIIILLGLVGVLIAGCSLPTTIAETGIVPASSLAQISQVTPVVPNPTPESYASGQDSIPNVDPAPWPNTLYPGDGVQGGNWGMHGNWGMSRGGQGMPGGGWGMGGHNGRMMGGNWSTCCGSGGYGRGLLPEDDTTAPVAPEEVSFVSDIQPIFNERCVVCHGGSSGLFLSSYEEVLRGGNNGPVITPGDPTNSRLNQYVNSGYMPYGGPPLAFSQAQTLMNWVATGAPNN